MSKLLEGTVLNTKPYKVLADPDVPKTYFENTVSFINDEFWYAQYSAFNAIYEAVSESNNISYRSYNSYHNTTREILDDIVFHLRESYDILSANIMKYNIDITGDDYSIIENALVNGITLYDITKADPTILESNLFRSIYETNDLYLDEFSITQHYMGCSVSKLSTLKSSFNKITADINSCIATEDTIYGLDPYNSVDDLKSLVKNIAEYAACVCEAVESNYRNIKIDNVVKESSILELSMGFNNAANRFYDKDSSSDVSSKISWRREVLSTVDKFTNSNLELSYINSSIPKLKKILASIEIDYKNYINLPPEEQKNNARYIDTIEKGVYAASKVTGVFFGGFSLEKPDRYDVHAIKSNAKYNIGELKRCIKYLEKRKVKLERDKLRGGKNK